MLQTWLTAQNDPEGSAEVLVRVRESVDRFTGNGTGVNFRYISDAGFSSSNRPKVTFDPSFDSER